MLESNAAFTLIPGAEFALEFVMSDAALRLAAILPPRMMKCDSLATFLKTASKNCDSEPSQRCTDIFCLVNTSLTIFLFNKCFCPKQRTSVAHHDRMTVEELA